MGEVTYTRYATIVVCYTIPCVLIPMIRFETYLKYYRNNIMGVDKTSLLLCGPLNIEILVKE